MPTTFLLDALEFRNRSKIATYTWQESGYKRRLQVKVPTVSIV